MSPKSINYIVDELCGCMKYLTGIEVNIRPILLSQPWLYSVDKNCSRKANQLVS